MIEITLVSGENFGPSSYLLVVLGICVKILTLKSDITEKKSDQLKSITYTLRGLCNYIRVSSLLCKVCKKEKWLDEQEVSIRKNVFIISILTSEDVTNAGIVPILASYLSDLSFLQELDRNSVSLCWFLSGIYYFDHFSFRWSCCCFNWS